MWIPIGREAPGDDQGEELTVIQIERQLWAADILTHQVISDHAIPPATQILQPVAEENSATVMSMSLKEVFNK